MLDSIVLVESHYRSRSWFLALKNIGLTHIISVIPEERNLFIKKGFNKSNILNLYFDGEIIKKNHRSASYYEEFLETKMNTIVSMDRTLRRKTRFYIKNYLTFLLNKLDIFFLSVKPKIIFIEPTWTHELLICKFAKKYNVSIVAPVKDKLLPDRFIAFKNENHFEFYKTSNFQNAHHLSRKAFDLVFNDKPIQYFKRFNKRNKFDLQKIPKLYRLVKISILNSRNPNIQNSLHSDIYVKIKSIIRSYTQLFLFNFKKLNQISKKYILITLHVQPEASIDVVGSKYSNQIEFIRKIAHTTPNHFTLLIKEHSHAIGNRKSSFYSDLLEIPNVELLHPNENARKAIRNSSLVISNTGTSSFEAGILNIPSITSTEMFFYKLMIKKEFNPYEESISDLLKNKKTKNKNFIFKYLEDIYIGSFSGNCGDFQTDSNVLSNTNLKKLQDSFHSIIKLIKKNKR